MEADEVERRAVPVEGEGDQRRDTLTGRRVMPGELEAVRRGVRHDPIPHDAEPVAVRIPSQRHKRDAGRRQAVAVGLPEKMAGIPLGQDIGARQREAPSTCSRMPRAPSR